MTHHYDVIVLGLGGMGSAALAHLAQRRLRVVGLEQFQPVHALGSSHGSTRVIRQAYFEDPAYVPLLLRAYELWRELEAQTGRRIFLKTGGLMAGSPGAAVVTGSLRSAREHGLPHELLAGPDLRRRFPALQPAQDEVALYEPEAGILFPEEAILAHLEVAVAHGAEARFGTRVLGWEPTPAGGVRVLTGQGEVVGACLVICAGAWFSEAAPDLGLPLKVERNVMHWFEPGGDQTPLGPGSLPIYIRQREGEPVFYGFPALPGQGLKAAFHHSGHLTTPGEVTRTVSPDEVSAMRRALDGWLPGAAGDCLRSEVCLYTNTPDEHFVVGPHPHHPQVILAGGFSGHGFKFAGVMGEVLADLATGDRTAHPVRLFSPDRFRT